MPPSSRKLVTPASASSGTTTWKLSSMANSSSAKVSESTLYDAKGSPGSMLFGSMSYSLWIRVLRSSIVFIVQYGQFVVGALHAHDGIGSEETVFSSYFGRRKLTSP